MAEDTVAALSRLISLVRLIDNQPGITVGELSQHFGRSKARIRSDIRLLDRAGVDDLLPGCTFEIDYDLFLEQDAVSLRSPLNIDAPLPITRQEFASVVTALQAMAPTLDEDDLQLLPQTLSALITALDATDAAELGTGSGLTIPTMSQSTRQMILLIQKAMVEGRSITFSYLNRAGVESHRVVTPEALVQERDGWIVRGMCHRAMGERSFRLDRASGLSLADSATFARRTTSPTSNRLEEVGETVTVTLSSEAAWALKESPARTVKTARDGTIVAVFQSWDPVWMRTELLTLAPYVLDVLPRVYLEEASDFARRALASQERGPHGRSET
ncbi:helix-turn-helix transcriptional regulator [Actinomyces minihominis]|uniref:helix-turn-helix transcriptional regulator n=1 Tax=Actinomyces minihominis TaxID=2002838 RepID=UPI0013EBC506|nr:WYL domain-containing protein [Actinomyces minihominis]